MMPLVGIESFIFSRIENGEFFGFMHDGSVYRKMMDLEDI